MITNICALYVYVFQETKINVVYSRTFWKTLAVHIISQLLVFRIINQVQIKDQSHLL